MPHSPEIKAFIRKKSDLFWYTPKEKKEYISKDLLLETIFNYASLKECLELIDLLEKDEALKILQNARGRKKLNYYPEIYHFFTLYLEGNA